MKRTSSDHSVKAAPVSESHTPGGCKFRWLGGGLGWDQVEFCEAELSCPEPGYSGTMVGELAYSSCFAEDGDG